MPVKHTDSSDSLKINEYLTSKGVGLINPPESKLSDAKAYTSCYNWYIEKQKVMPENASLASRVWVDKYALHNKDGVCLESTPEDMWDRIATTLATVEPLNQAHWRTVFRELQEGFGFTGQGSVLYSLGNPYTNSSSSNCFLTTSPDDSIEGIFGAASRMARIFSRRGGVGICLDNLRPTGASVNNAAKTTSGANSYMDFYSYVTGLIGQAGRRGALMITMSVSHPDIERFIEEKSDKRLDHFFNELAEVGIDINDSKYFGITSRLKSTTNANVSVVVSREFLTAVENDSDWELRFDFKDNLYPSIVKVVKAKEVWDKITYAAWKSAEPGILNMTEIRENSPADSYSDLSDLDFLSEDDRTYSFRTEGTNPCVPGHTWVQTSSGPRRAKELVTAEFQAVVNGQSHHSTPFWSTGIKPTFKVTTNRGYNLEATANHKLLTKNGWTTLEQLKPGDTLILNSHNGGEWSGPQEMGQGLFDSGWLVGEVVGDGCYNPEKFRTQVQFWGADAEYMANLSRQIISSLDYAKHTDSPVEFGSEVTHKGKSDYAVKTKILDKVCGSLILPESKLPTDNLEKRSSSFIRGFIRGLFDADGTVLSNPIKGSSIRLVQVHKEVLYFVQRSLLRLGIVSTVYENRTQATHELVVSRDMVEKFAEIIGFYEPSKIKKLQSVLSSRIRVPYKTSFTTKVVAIEPCGHQEVFDCTVDEVHAFDANGIMAHNCSELPLSFGDTCTLGSFFLPFYVKDGVFDFALFRSNIKVGVRFMDNVKTWDYKCLPLPENEKPSRLGRRVGLGIHGLADCLAMLGLKYDTTEAVEVAEQIVETLKNTAYMASVDLGKEKGVFPAFSWEKEKNNAFIKRLAPEVQEAIQKYGRRNISMLTIAPTGSISILSRNCSSGIEPVFKKAYLRNVKKQGSEEVDTFTIHHQAIEDHPALESLFVEANEVDPEQRIIMQAALQRHIDHAISSTLNLKADTTQEQVSTIYLHAFQAGLKGVTVYRDGCRAGILNSIKPKEVSQKIQTERPKTTDINIHKVKYKNQSYMVLIGMVGGRPIEVFGGLEDGLALPTKYQSAQLTKKSRGHYSLTVQLSDDPEDVLKVNNIGARFPAEDIMTLTRLVSLSLRNGVPIGDIVDQLQKSAGGLFDAPAIFARVLKNYMTDGDVQKLTTTACPLCGGQTEMKREGGCFVETCMTISCGYVNSKCN